MLARISRFDLSRIPQYPVLYGLLAALLALVLILLFVGRVPVSYNVRNLVVRWWITTMMVLAFVLVVGLMTVMMAFVSGMDALTGNSGQPGNIVVFSSGANDEGFSNLALSDVSNLERASGWPAKRSTLSSTRTFRFPRAAPPGDASSRSAALKTPPCRPRSMAWNCSREASGFRKRASSRPATVSRCSSSA
jgi:hypothetical protein